MSDIIDKYLQYIKLELNLSEHTQVAYGNDLRQWEQFLTGGGEQLDVASVTASDIRAWLLQLSGSGSTVMETAWQNAIISTLTGIWLTTTISATTT